MTTLNYPRDYAGDATFTSGPDTGQPTKVDPGAGVEEQGLIPGVAVAAATLNYSLNSHSTAARYMAEQALLSLAPLQVPQINFIQAYEDAHLTTGCALEDGDRNYVLLGTHPAAFEDRSGQLSALSAPAMGSSVDPVSAAVAATDTWGCISEGLGDAVTVTTDGGSTWSDVNVTAIWTSDQPAAAAIGSVLVFSGAIGDVESVSSPYSSAVNHSVSAVFDRTSAMATDGTNLLVLRSQSGIATGTDVTTTGTAYADAGGSFISPDSIGYLSCDGTNFYWAGTKTTGDTTVQVSADAGASWSEVTTIAHSFTAETADTSHVLACVPNSGVIWMAVKDTVNSWYMYASADGGVNWIGPRFLTTSTTPPSFSVAGGHLYVGLPGLPMLRTFWRLS